MFNTFFPKTGKIRYSPQDTGDNIIGTWALHAR